MKAEDMDELLLSMDIPTLINIIEDCQAKILIDPINEYVVNEQSRLIAKCRKLLTERGVLLNELGA